MTHAEFWQVSMRELQQRIEAAGRRHKAEHEARLAVAALQTAELVNVVGSLGAGKKWKPIKPTAYFEAWTGREKPVPTLEEYKAKRARVLAEVEAIAARKRAKKATLAGTETEKQEGA